MTSKPNMTVGDVLAALSRFDPELPIRYFYDSGHGLGEIDTIHLSKLGEVLLFDASIECPMDEDAPASNMGMNS